MKLLGITEDVITCDCCGRTNLKCTVAFQSEDSSIRYYGRTCASNWYGKPSRTITAELKSIETEARQEASRLFQSEPVYAEYRNLLQSLNNRKISFQERRTLIQPVAERHDAKRKEICLTMAQKYMLKPDQVWIAL